MEIELKLHRFDVIVRRKDIKQPTWFGLENDIINHPDFFSITPEGFKIFIWVVAIGSKCNKALIRIDTALCAHQCRIDEKIVIENIEKLKGKRWDIISRDGHVTDALRARDAGVTSACLTDTHTNRHIEQTNTSNNNTLVDQPKNKMHEIGQLWNQHKPKELQPIKTTGGDREKLIKKYWDKLTPEQWIETFKRIDKSNWLKGVDPKSSGWKATFEWAVKNHINILEGNYDSNGGSSKGRSINFTESAASTDFEELDRIAAGFDGGSEN